MTQNSWNSQKPAQVVLGGTGAAILTGVLIGNGTSAITGNPITQYDPLIGGPSNAISSISPGASGTVLKSQGASANPIYASQAAVGGSLVYITQQTANVSTSLDFTSNITSTYKNYLFRIYNVVSSLNNSTVSIRFSTNNGSSFITSSYLTGLTYNSYNSTTITDDSTSGGPRIMGPQSNSASFPTSCGYLWLFNTSSTSYSCVLGRACASSSTLSRNQRSAVSYLVAQGINAVRFFNITGGTITTGTFVMYGLLEA